MTIWTTCTRFNMGKLTKAEAKSIISKINLKPISEYASCVQKDLGVILKEPKRSKKVLAQSVDEPTIIDDTHEVVKQENE